jgi:nicotinate-nucleotide--dimethylbenzimidazole phosphoribosyltransferase
MTLPNETVRAHLDQLTKPPGSLGRLEDLASELCRIQGTLEPETRPRRAVLFAGDHGVVASGVSAWPSEVTGLMVANIAGGGAASSALAAAGGTELRLVDVGCAGPEVPANGVLSVERVRTGTRDLSQEAALTVAEFEAAFEVGERHARLAAEDGMRLVMTGEMGIGNTTPATALARLILGESAPAGPGAGADAAMVRAKSELIDRAVARVRRDVDLGEGVGFETLPEEARRQAIAALGGLEIAAMAGFFAGAAAAGLVVFVDGLIATAAALVADELHPGSTTTMIAAHRSAEPAHSAMLEALGLSPYLDWNLRLGEGTGALLLAPLADAAAAMCRDMATFADLGIGG